VTTGIVWVFVSNCPWPLGFWSLSRRTIGHQYPIEYPIAGSRELLQKAENPATMRDFAMARPGLEPGTPPQVAQERQTNDAYDAEPMLPPALQGGHWGSPNPASAKSQTA
jgi:hypothetical protein